MTFSYTNCSCCVPVTKNKTVFYWQSILSLGFKKKKRKKFEYAMYKAHTIVFDQKISYSGNVLSEVGVSMTV